MKRKKHSKSCQLLPALFLTHMYAFVFAMKYELQQSVDSLQEQQYQPCCLDDTRVDLLKKLQDWSDSHQKPIFWLSGGAGTGKSTISRTLAVKLQSQKQLGGTFFFSRSVREVNNAQKFVSTLAYCMAKTSAQLKAQIREALTANADVLRQGLRNQWTELIISPLTKLIDPQPRTMNFVIDALDECGSDDEIRTLIQLFVDLKDISSVNIGVFVTSRPEIPIRLGFKNVPKTHHSQLDLRQIPRETVEHDIMLFIRERLAKVAREREIPQ